jgi:hypothetical protein
LFEVGIFFDNGKDCSVSVLITTDRTWGFFRNSKTPFAKRRSVSQRSEFLGKFLAEGAISKERERQPARLARADLGKLS